MLRSSIPVRKRRERCATCRTATGRNKILKFEAISRPRRFAALSRLWGATSISPIPPEFRRLPRSARVLNNLDGVRSVMDNEVPRSSSSRWRENWAVFRRGRVYPGPARDLRATWIAVILREVMTASASRTEARSPLQVGGYHHARNSSEAAADGAMALARPMR